MADNASTQTSAPAPEEKKPWKLPSLHPDSMGYFLLWREGSGLVLSFLLISWQLINWTPTGPIGVYFTWFIGAGILVWYNAAQRNALIFAAEEKRAEDDRQIARDTGWSSLPTYTLWFFAGITLTGLILANLTDLFDNPESHWIRDRLIVDWPFAGYLFWILLTVRGDQTRHSELLAKIKRLSQRFRRDEH